jgi:hypothetical protein
MTLNAASSRFFLNVWACRIAFLRPECVWAYGARMSTTGPSDSRIRVIRALFLLFATTSFALGGWMMLDPESAWRLMGIEAGPTPLAQALYGGAIMGEGLMAALGLIWPVRYLVFLQYMVAYKTFACLAAVGLLVRLDDPPTAGWMVVASWAFPAVASAAVFPWRQWSSVEEWYGAQ